MRLLYKTAHIEGWSYLILLFVAMPLKYLGGIATPVKIIGQLHGLLFLTLLVLVLIANKKKRLDLLTATLIMLASLVPFATFYTERIVDKYNRKSTL